MRYILLLLTLFYGFWQSGAQSLSDRIEAEYSIKEITPDGKSTLIVGKAFYTLSGKTLTHQQTFPAHRVIVFHDTVAFQIEKDSVSMTSSSAMSIDFSIYNLILNNHITDFGLEKLGFNLVNVSEKEDKVISKWKFPSGDTGYVAITQTDGRVDGVIFYKRDGEPLVKQYFRDYVKVGKLFFPSKIFEIIITPLGENKKITTHRNIKVDDFSDEDEYYRMFTDTFMELIRSKKN